MVAKANKAAFEEGRGYTKQDWDEVSDNPEWTEEDFKKARTFADAFPELAESIKRSRGRPPKDHTKKAISIRLDQEVIDKFKATGPGWQSRMNEILKRADV